MRAIVSEAAGVWLKSRADRKTRRLGCELQELHEAPLQTLLSSGRTASQGQEESKPRKEEGEKERDRWGRDHSGISHPLLFLVFMCARSHMCVCVCAHAHIREHVHAHAEAREPQVSSLRVLSLTWNSQSKLCWQVSGPQGSACLYHPALKFLVTCHHTWVVCLFSCLFERST